MSVDPNREDIRDRFIQSWVTRIERAVQREVCIREGKAPSPQTPMFPEDLLRALAWLACIAQDSDNKALTKASRSRDWLTRFGAALHPQASDGILQVLARDADADVSAAGGIPRGSLLAPVR